MNKLAGAFLAIGVLAAACGDDGNSANAPGAAGDGTGATETDGGDGPVLGGGSAGTSGSAATPGGEGGTQSPPAGGASGQGTDTSVSLGGATEDVRGDPPIDPSCGDYQERENRFNDTGLAIDKDELTICGRLNAYQFTPSDYEGYLRVDSDYYRLAVLTDGDYFVSIEFPEDAPSQDFTRININPGYYGGGVGLVEGKQGGAWVALDDFTGASIYVDSYAMTDLDHSIPYKLHIRKDSPADRCTTVKPADAKQSYTEAHDGATNKGNDVVHYKFFEAQMPTASAADAPEPSGVVLNIGDHSLLQGNAALVDYGDDYYDTDMYAFKTGTSDVVTLRLDWPDFGPDLDLMLFDANDLTFQYLKAATNTTTYGPELFTVIVKPNTSYWLYVAAGNTSTQGSIPSAYTVTMCGEKFKL